MKLMKYERRKMKIIGNNIIVSHAGAFASRCNAAGSRRAQAAWHRRRGRRRARQMKRHRRGKGKNNINNGIGIISANISRRRFAGMGEEK